MSLVVVIPTLNAAATLPATLGALDWCGRVVVADGGSTDATVAVARQAGATVVTAPAGRGPQLAAGAASTTEDWLLFLHADTLLGAGWRNAVEQFIGGPANATCAGYFRLRLASDQPAARRVERMAAWRAGVIGLPYGDQGLLIARRFYEEVGGFHPLPLMEDVNLVRRIGRARLRAIPVEAVTSAARYERDGWWLRPVRNLACLSLYFAGVPPRTIRKLYG